MDKPIRSEGMSDVAWHALWLEYQEDRADNRFAWIKETLAGVVARLDSGDRRMTVIEDRQTRDELDTADVRKRLWWIVGLGAIGIFGIMATLATTLFSLLIKLAESAG